MTEPLTVDQLIAALSSMPHDAPVYYEMHLSDGRVSDIHAWPVIAVYCSEREEEIEVNLINREVKL